MKTLSDLDLSNVTGGKASPSANIAGNGGGGGGGNNDQILSSLQNIQSSLKDLGKNNNGLFGGNNALMFGMALAMSRRNSQVVVYGNNCRSGFRWRVW